MVLDFLAQYEVYGYLKQWQNLQGWERRSSGKFTILLVFLRKRRHWAFSLFKQYASVLGSTHLSEDSSV